MRMCTCGRWGVEKSYNFHSNSSESLVNPGLATHTCSSETGANGAAAGAWGGLSRQVSGTAPLCATSTRQGLHTNCVSGTMCLRRQRCEEGLIRFRAGGRLAL